MTDYKYDFHVHSCLSPCADDDMTPMNIAGMSALNGLQLVALTDHNTCRNCPAFFDACKQYGIVPVPGMELCTSEEVHVICLFRTLEDAMNFSAIVEQNMMSVKNKPDIFGNQLVIGLNDNVVEEMETLLITATSISITDAVKLVHEHFGVCYPAHIDRDANGILAMLGFIPKEAGFTAFELSPTGKLSDYLQREDCRGKLHFVSSDAHHLWDLSDGKNIISIDDEPYCAQRVRDALVDMIGPK